MLCPKVVDFLSSSGEVEWVLTEDDFLLSNSFDFPNSDQTLCNYDFLNNCVS